MTTAHPSDLSHELQQALAKIALLEQQQNQQAIDHQRHLTEQKQQLEQRYQQQAAQLKQQYQQQMDVVEKAIAIWRKAAEDLLVEVERLRKENKHLVCELAKVRKTSELIISLLQKISPENAQRIVDELSKINNNDENQQV